MDRNIRGNADIKHHPRSLSARRAWIEIYGNKAGIKSIASLSARRAWIEIVRRGSLPRPTCVALRKESVDRNNLLLSMEDEDEAGRSPQGERG